MPNEAQQCNELKNILIFLPKAATGMGTVRMTLFAREKIEEVLDYIKEHCDITSDENGRRLIYSTGLGGNMFRSRIEEELNVE